MGELIDFIVENEQPFKSANRLASLYSDFSNLKTSNPDGYHANVDAWISALTHATRAGVVPGSGSLVIKVGDALAGELQVKGLGRPVALDEVFGNAVSNKTMLPLRDFLDSERSIYDKRWMQLQIPSPWQLAKWGLKKIGFGGSANTLSSGEFVILANVEIASKALISRLATMRSAMTTSTSLIYSLETFTSSFSDLELLSTSTSKTSHPNQLSPSDIQILLRYITRDKQIAVSSTDPTTGIVVIKFSASGSSRGLAPVTQHDTTIASFHTLALNLNTQVTTLQTRIDALATNTRTALASGQRTIALSHLRAKKTLEATLAKRITSLEQIESTLSAIDEAAGQVEMVQALEAGGKVLKDLNQRVGGVERVETVMDNLRHEFENVDDVSKVIGDTGLESGIVDEEEVDEEMERLEKEVADQKKQEAVETKREEDEKLIEELPNVPTGPFPANELKESRRESDVVTRLRSVSLDEPRQVQGEAQHRSEEQSQEAMSG